MHYYQHHIGDFIKDTSNLDDRQLAAYMRMLWIYYTEEKPLQGDCEDIAFAVRSDEKTVRQLLKHYFNETPEGWSHGRCDREIAEYRAKTKKNRDAANARWSNRTAKRQHTECNANVSENDANQEPTSNIQEPSIEAPQSAANKRGTRLPQDWALPLKWGEWTLSQFPTWTPATVRAEADKFRDFWHSKAGKGACKLDWEATWRNWCRNAKPSIQGQPQRETPYAQHMRERVEQAAGSLAHIVAAKAPGQYQRIREPWEVAADEQRTIENGQTGTPAISMD